MSLLSYGVPSWIYLTKYSSDEINPFTCKCSILLSLILCLKNKGVVKNVKHSINLWCLVPGTISITKPNNNKLLWNIIEKNGSKAISTKVKSKKKKHLQEIGIIFFEPYFRRFWWYCRGHHDKKMQYNMNFIRSLIWLFLEYEYIVRLLVEILQTWNLPN